MPRRRERKRRKGRLRNRENTRRGPSTVGGRCLACPGVRKARPEPPKNSDGPGGVLRGKGKAEGRGKGAAGAGAGADPAGGGGGKMGGGARGRTTRPCRWRRGGLAS